MAPWGRGGDVCRCSSAQHSLRDPTRGKHVKNSGDAVILGVALVGDGMQEEARLHDVMPQRSLLGANASSLHDA